MPLLIDLQFGVGEIPIGQWASINLGHNGFNHLGGGYSYPVPAGSDPGGVERLSQAALCRGSVRNRMDASRP